MTEKQLNLLKKLETRENLILITKMGNKEDWVNEIAYNKEDKCYHHADTGFFKIDLEWIIQIIKGQVDWCEIKEVKHEK